jgi:hypothetical protein
VLQLSPAEIAAEPVAALLMIGLGAAARARPTLTYALARRTPGLRDVEGP